MRRGVTAVTSLLLVISVAALASDPDPTTDQQTKQGKPKIIKRLVGSAAWFRAGLGAGVNQANDTPHEWGQGSVGFGRRFASAFGKHIVKFAIQYPVASIRHEEFGYHPSGKQGFKPRLMYAMVGTVITHKTTTGKRTVSTSELAGAFGSGLISRLWQPASVRAVSYGFLSGGITLGVDAAGNVIKEFWPEIRHPRSHSRTAKAAVAHAPDQAVLTAPSSSVIEPSISAEEKSSEEQVAADSSEY